MAMTGHPFMTLLVLLMIADAVPAGPATLTIERLTWAGIRMEAGETTVLIDAIGTDIWGGDAPGGLIPVEADTRGRYALVTHTHNDHFDPETLKRVLGERGYVIVAESDATYVASRGLRVIPARLYEPVRRGGFLFTAVPAADGVGAEQVSWVIAYENERYLHAGDTLWHGKWDLIGDQYGPFDTVFLPINGARLGREPVIDTPGKMTPAQGLDAAVLLRAGRLVPIHYGNDDPPYYREVAEPLDTLLQNAAGRDVAVLHVLPGERVPPR